MTTQSSDLESGDVSTQLRGPVLQVIDAPFDGSAPESHISVTLVGDTAASLRGLPQHREGTARIFDLSLCSDTLSPRFEDEKDLKANKSAQAGLREFLQATYNQDFKERRSFNTLKSSLHLNDIMSISSQWTQQLISGASHLSWLITRTSLQQDPFNYSLHTRNSYLTCAQDTDNRLVG
jgi:hypothetical protein